MKEPRPTQPEIVFDALVNGSTYSHIEGCNILHMGCYQRIVSKLIHDFGIPVESVSVKNVTNDGYHNIYFLRPTIRRAIQENNLNLYDAGRYFANPTLAL